MLIKTLFGVVVLPAALGLVLGSYIFYIPSYIYGKAFLDRWGKYIGVTWNDVETLNARFAKTKWDEVSIILARIALIPSVMVTVFCGAMRIPPKKYSIITFIGGFFKALSVALIGWSAGELYMQYAEGIDKIERWALVVISIVVAAFIWYRKSRKKVVESTPHQ